MSTLNTSSLGELDGLGIRLTTLPTPWTPNSAPADVWDPNAPRLNIWSEGSPNDIAWTADAPLASDWS